VTGTVPVGAEAVVEDTLLARTGEDRGDRMNKIDFRKKIDHKL
jgi:hypothetical protein